MSGVETVIKYGPEGKNGGVGATVMFGPVVWQCEARYYLVGDAMDREVERKRRLFLLKWI
jgi:hypothetical protein